jgi:hypothetical protein
VAEKLDDYEQLIPLAGNILRESNQIRLNRPQQHSPAPPPRPKSRYLATLMTSVSRWWSRTPDTGLDETKSRCEIAVTAQQGNVTALLKGSFATAHTYFRLQYARQTIEQSLLLSGKSVYIGTGRKDYMPGIERLGHCFNNSRGVRRHSNETQLPYTWQK